MGSSLAIARELFYLRGKMKTVKIAFYGKGGIGKSTIASNLAAAFGKMGLKVLFIGCDPKADSTKSITGKKLQPLITAMLEKGDSLTREEILHYGFSYIACVETGGPSPGVGCAGRGIISMVEELERHEIFEEDWDVILYDVLGDVVCGGFAVPMREGFVDHVYIVSSGEFMSIYAANNILKSIENFSSSRSPFLCGLIYNHRQNHAEFSLMRDFAKKSHVPIVAEIPFSPELILSELEHKTTAEKFPSSEIAHLFQQIAKKILHGQEKIIPKPLDEESMDTLSQEFLAKISGAKND